MACSSRRRLFRISRRADQWPGAIRVPISRQTSLASATMSAQPESLEGEKNQGALFPAISIDDRKRVIADGLVGEARMLAARERFFHWEIGFPMSGSISPAPNLKAALTRFGNPPYVRQELLGDGVKRALKGGYKAFDGVADSMFTSTSKGCVFCGPAAAWATSSPTNG